MSHEAQDGPQDEQGGSFTHLVDTLHETLYEIDNILCVCMIHFGVICGNDGITETYYLIYF